MAQRIPILNYTAAGDKQRAFHNSDHTITIAIGAVGSGKTYMACAELLRQLLVEDGGHGKTALVVGRTHAHVRDQLVPIFQMILDNRDKRGKQRGIDQTEYKLLRSSPMVMELPFGSKIIFWSIEAGQKIKGLNVTHALIDEAPDMDEKDFDDCFDRTGREGVPGRVWLCGNPSNKYNWVFKRFWKEFEDHGNRPENAAYCVGLTYRDNPYTEHKWAAWEKLYGYSPIERMRKLEGLWVDTTGMVFNQWQPEKHVFDRQAMSIGRDWQLYGGLDFGYRDPTAGLRIAKTPDGQIFVYNEYYQSGGDGIHIPEHALWFANRQWPQERIIEIFSDTHLDTVASYKRAGMHNIKPVAKPPGSIVAGCALINQLLGSNRLFIAKDCTNLIKEIETYTWSTNAREEPKKGFGDHAIDALRYACLSLCAGVDMTVCTMADTIRPVRVEDRPIFCYETNEFGQTVPVYLAA